MRRMAAARARKRAWRQNGKIVAAFASTSETGIDSQMPKV